MRDARFDGWSTKVLRINPMGFHGDRSVFVPWKRPGAIWWLVKKKYSHESSGIAEMFKQEWSKKPAFPECTKQIRCVDKISGSIDVPPTAAGPRFLLIHLKRDFTLMNQLIN